MSNKILKPLAVGLLLGIATLSVSTAYAERTIVKGDKGVNSDIGPMGPQGPQGNPGINGTNGTNGAQGVAGADGLKGADGAAGPAGVKGDTGAASIVPGPAGTNGTNGAAGADSTVAGPKGDAGTNGLPGAKGDVGPAGTGPVGTATGDMQWWNVNHWERIPVGENNTTLKNCDGIPTWVADHCFFQIGDTGPAGGKVFYLTDATGKHGLEAAPVDQPLAQWGSCGKDVVGTSTDIGTGLANTNAINAVCGVGTAAYKAANYSSNGLGGWYLPSKDEMTLMYTNIGYGAQAPNTNVGNFLYGYTYWSSSQYNVAFALMINPINNVSYGDFIQFHGLSRPVRTF